MKGLEKKSYKHKFLALLLSVVMSVSLISPGLTFASEPGTEMKELEASMPVDEEQTDTPSIDEGVTDGSDEADPENVGDSQKEDPETADDGQQADPGTADDSQQEDPENADDSQQEDPENADDSQQEDPEITDDGQQEDPENIGDEQQEDSESAENGQLEVTGSLDAVYQPLGRGTMVVVNDGNAQILDFQCGSPRHHQHHHAGKQ